MTFQAQFFQKFWQCKGMGDMGTFASSNRADDEWLEAELWAAGMKRVTFNATSQHNLLSTFAHIALSQLLKSLDSQPCTVLSPASKSFLLLWGFNNFYIFLLYMVYGMLILHSSTLFSWACQKQASLKDKSCSTGFHRCTVWPSFIFQASCIFKQPLSILPVFVPVSSCLGLLLSVGCMTVCHTNSWPVGFGVLTVVLRGLVGPRMSFLTKIYEHISRLEM